MPDTMRGRDKAGMPTETRIIGIELRYVTPYGGREEVAVIPCDVRLPAQLNAAMRGRINCTLHTSTGDTTFPHDAELPLG